VVDTALGGQPANSSTNYAHAGDATGNGGNSGNGGNGGNGGEGGSGNGGSAADTPADVSDARGRPSSPDYSEAGPVADASGQAGGLGDAGGDAGRLDSAAGEVALCPGATQILTVGVGQQYATVQAAVDAVPSSNRSPVQIAVKAGTYQEQVTISQPFICLTGEGATTTTITNALGTNIDTGGTVIVTGNDFSSANIAFANTGGYGSGQAVALMAEGQRQQFYSCRFVSYQDTLYVNTGTQYFRSCYIQGDTDYVFGDATAVFEDCTMNNVAAGTAVAAPRTPQNNPYGLVFLGGSLTANATTSTVGTGSVYLARPWGPYGAAAYLNVAMGGHIAADGWTTMSSNTLAAARFWEYHSTGPGANPTNPTRATRQLTAAQAADYTVANVLAPWVPGYSP